MYSMTEVGKSFQTLYSLNYSWFSYSWKSLLRRGSCDFTDKRELKGSMQKKIAKVVLKFSDLKPPSPQIRGIDQ